MLNARYLSFLIGVLFVLSGCDGTGQIVADDDDVSDDDTADDDDDTGDDDDDTGDDDDDVTGEFATEVEILDIHMVPSPVPEEPPQLAAMFRYTYINTYASIAIDTVTPGTVRILRVDDDTEVVSLLVEPTEPWDPNVPADSTVTVEYEMMGVAGPPPGPQELPCEDEVYAEGEVNYGSGEAVSAISVPVIFNCGGPGPEDDPAG